MKINSDRHIKSLRLIANRYDSESNHQKLFLLHQLSKSAMKLSRALIEYMEVLIFLRAFPPNKEVYQIAERESLKIAAFLNGASGKKDALLPNTGLPYTPSVSGFSHDFISWLNASSDCKVSIHNKDHVQFDLNQVLKLTLPSLERSETTAGHSDEDLLDALLIRPDKQLSFLLNELSRFNHQPYVKDHFFEGLGLNFELKSRTKLFSKAFNRLSGSEVFYHDEIIKKVDTVKLLNSKVAATRLTGQKKTELIRVIKYSLALTDRETDPVTYMDERSLRLYELERGISVAIYGLEPSRQLPLESYVGYTLFKNGFPAAYGGGWVFGESAHFGINIFETFRGGESGYMMCQLLRVYRQIFQINYFEVEPYQYGLDNPDGITSGAFWFYYRYGFRPLDKKLRKVAETESKKIALNKNYRTSKKTLISFTATNIALNIGDIQPERIYEIGHKVKELIHTKYDDNRILAEKACVENFRKSTGFKAAVTPNQESVLKEVALWAAVSKTVKKEKLKLLMEMVRTKPVDLYNYQKLLLKFFSV